LDLEPLALLLAFDPLLAYALSLIAKVGGDPAEINFFLYSFALFYLACASAVDALSSSSYLCMITCC